MSRGVSLSVEGIVWCCSATNLGNSGGGHDCVPVLESGMWKGMTAIIMYLVVF